MQALRVLANCLASGQPLEAGRAYAVPEDLSAADAEALVRMGRAEPAEQAATPEAKPKRTRKRADA